MLSNYRLVVALCVSLLFLTPALAQKGQKTQRQEPTRPGAAQTPGGNKQGTGGAKDTGRQAPVKKSEGQAAADSQSEGNPGEIPAAPATPEGTKSAQTTTTTSTPPASANSIALDLLRSDIVALSIGAVLGLALLLHIVHLFEQLGTRKRMAELARKMDQLKQLALAGNSSAAESAALAGQLRQQDQSLKQVSDQLRELEERLKSSEQHKSDAVEAMVKLSEWMMESEVRQAAPSQVDEDGDASNSGRLLALESARNALDANAARVGPLRSAMSALTLRLRNNGKLPPDVVSRAEGLQTAIEEFSRWQREAEELISLLQRGSWKERQSQMRADCRRLASQLDAGQITISEHVERLRELMAHYVSPASGGASRTAIPADYEAQLKKRTAGAADYLMDWFDGFYQLLIQAQSIDQADNNSTEPGAATVLQQVTKTAREVLGKFDVQVEEIQVGRTAYDRRLHEAALIRQSAHVPANTVIGVQRCGFRRMSTGEVLRRPQVVVASASAG